MGRLPTDEDLRNWSPHGDVSTNGHHREPGDEPDGVDLMEPTLLALDTVTPRPIEWLWPGRFAIGKYSEIVGDPGLGKSFLTIDMASRTSRGWKWPDGSANRAGGVVLMSAEDDPEDTIVPRLNESGADLTRIKALQSVTLTDPESRKRYERSVHLTTDLDAVEAAILRTPDCRVVFIDPVTAYMGKADTHKDSDVRGTLAPLCKMAAEHRVAIVGVKHMNKASGSSALYRATGSLAFVAAARAVWIVCKDRCDVTGRRRLLLPLKNNLANDTKGLAYELRVRTNGGLPVLAWEDREVDTTAAEALEPYKPERQSKADMAEEWLSSRLAGGQSVASDELESEAKKAGISTSTYRRARTQLGVESVKDCDRWLSRLPA